MGDQFRLAQQLLPDDAGAYELASLAALAEVMPIDTAAASTVWDPWNCPGGEFLANLAARLSVDLWFDDWDELKKRSVIAASPELHDLKTSIAGYRRFLALVDATLVDYIAPPKRFFAGETMSADERLAWLRGLPELRLYTGADILAADDFCLYADLDFSDAQYGAPDRGAVMTARKARIYDPATGIEALIGPVDFDTIASGTTTVTYERIAVPGAFDPYALTADLAYADVAYAVPFDPLAAQVYTWRTDVDTVGQQGVVSILDALPYGFSLVAALPQRVPLTRLAGWGLFADVGFADVAFSDDEDASLAFYDAYKIAQQGVKSGTPLVDAGGYADLDWIGWPTHTLHLLVNVSSPTSPSALIADAGFADKGFAIPDDLDRFNRAMRAAYVASGPSSDHVTISAECTRYLTLSDGVPLDGSFYFDMRIPRASA